MTDTNLPLVEQPDVDDRRGRPERGVRVVEVGPRDGLQNEAGFVPTPVKIAFIEALAAAGLPVVEATSFVNPKAVPQLADAGDVMRGVHRRSGVRYPVLVPNERGFDRALAAGVEAIALFTAATDAFARANVGTSIDGTFARFAPIADRARDADIWVRGYVSVAFGCPYSGAVQPSAVIAVASRLFALGCAEVSIADTIGVANPTDVDHLLRHAGADLPLDRIALHFHDTNNRAVRNVAAGLQSGITSFDSAAGGLGGCPFAPGAPGNLATETLVRFLEGQGVETGVDAAAVAAAVATLHATSGQ
ncbi:MAG: hydroxymethylglutaryl-CoA lyase [Chloroflexota bacterium]|nr:hydroxymethylglutaryl-CoA lyase [Chloroflexota bacterium]